MSRQPFDLTLSARDHRFEIRDEPLVYRVVGSPERIQGRRARPVEDAEHGEMLMGVQLALDERPNTRPADVPKRVRGVVDGVGGG